MAHRMIITLTDQEYAILAAEAAKKGEQPETLLREIMLQRLQIRPHAKHPITEQEFEEKLYSEGKILNIPTRQLSSNGTFLSKDALVYLGSSRGLMYSWPPI